MNPKPFSYKSCLAEMIVLSQYRHSGFKTVLAVTIGDIESGRLPDEVLLKDVRKQHGSRANILHISLENRRNAGGKELITLSTLPPNSGISIDFELTRHATDMKDLLALMRVDAIEYVGLSRADARVQTIIDGVEYQPDDYSELYGDFYADNPDTELPPAAPLQIAKSADSRTIRPFELTTNPVVSVCLILHNAEKVVERTLRSVLNQTLETIEILVADDCSADRTMEIVAEYAAIDQRILAWSNDREIGAAANLNECLMRARGQYIKPLEQTAHLTPKCLEEMVNVLQEARNVTLVSNVGKDTQLPDWFDPSAQRPTGNLASMVRDGLFAIADTIDSPSRVMFRADDIGRGFDTSLLRLANLEYWTRLLQKGDLCLIAGDLCDDKAAANSAHRSVRHYVELARDVIRIGDPSQGYGSLCQEGQTQFIHKSLLEIAYRFAAHEHNHGDNGSNELDSQQIDVDELLAVTLATLRTLGRCNYEPDREVVAKEWAVIRQLETNLRDLLQSASWRITVPLREINARRAGGSGDLPITMPGNIKLTGTVYETYLRACINKIELSRSWKITAPLRVVHRIFARQSEARLNNHVRVSKMAGRPHAMQRTPVSSGAQPKRGSVEF